MIVAADARYDWSPRSSMIGCRLAGTFQLRGTVLEHFVYSCARQAFLLIHY